MISQTKKLLFTASYFLIMIFVFPGCAPGNGHTDNITLQPTPMREIGDGGFLSGEPCGPPCFFYIAPNITSEEYAKEILKTFYNLEDCKYWDRSKEGGIRRITCPYIDIAGDRYIFVDFNKSDIVDRINFVPDKMITVEEVINVYGNPPGVYVVSKTEEGETPRLVFMVLSYDTINTELILPTQETESYSLLPSTPIEAISYHEISQKIFIQPWRGFQEYIINIP